MATVINLALVSVVFLPRKSWNKGEGIKGNQTRSLAAFSKIFSHFRAMNYSLDTGDVYRCYSKCIVAVALL